MKYLLLSVALLASPVILAQQTQTTTGQAQVTKTNTLDRAFFEKAIESGQKEITAGTIAQANSTDPQIIEFGRMMQRDHTSANEKLSMLAKNKGYEQSVGLKDSTDKSLEKLRTLQGEAFDKEYVAFMVQSHKEAVQLFTDHSNKTEDQEVKRIVTEILPTLKQHLQHAEQLKST